MHSHLLREIAKIGIGLFLADLVSVVLLGSAGFFPLTMLGVTWTADAIGPIAVFDFAVIVLLAHYAWNTRSPIRSSSERGILLFAGIVFLAVAVAHLARLMFGVSIFVGGYEVPLWLSWIGVAVTAYLSYASFHFARRIHA
jgi:hypothetical protein